MLCQKRTKWMEEKRKNPNGIALWKKNIMKHRKLWVILCLASNAIVSIQHSTHAHKFFVSVFIIIVLSVSVAFVATDGADTVLIVGDRFGHKYSLTCIAVFLSPLLCNIKSDRHYRVTTFPHFLLFRIP